MAYVDTDSEIRNLYGKTLSKAERVGEEIHFKDNEGNKYKMFHEQDCCENVHIEDICGDLEDLVGSPLLMAEEVISKENPSDSKFNKKAEDGEENYQDESFKWTFYNFATLKGYVTIRWYGSSNGYYSESVSFVKL